jgi:hypothetical protein
VLFDDHAIGLSAQLSWKVVQEPGIDKAYVLNYRHRSKLNSFEVKHAFGTPRKMASLEISPQGGEHVNPAKTIDAPCDHFQTREQRVAYFTEALELRGESFVHMLCRLIAQQGKTQPEIYDKARVDRQTFHKILTKVDDRESNRIKNYCPPKSVVLALAIACELPREQILALLSASGYTLSTSLIADVIVSHFIDQQVYEIGLINDMLSVFGQTLLGSGYIRKRSGK